MIKNIKHIILGAFILASTLAVASHAQAQDDSQMLTEPVVDIIPASSFEEDKSYDATTHTHPPIKLTPDKSELLRLDEPAGSIIIGNPNHLSILADTSQLLVLIPRAPGAAHFTILDRDGNVMMQRHAIVGSPQEKYIRVRNSCAGTGDDNCQPTQVYYCPDMCHSIAIATSEDGAAPVSSDGPSSGQVDIETIDLNPTDEPDQ